MAVSSGVRFSGSRFWVIHRRREYGPFDYEWSKDFRGVELLYLGEKFGEYCSPEEIFADLKEFGLPMRVVEVSSVVMGALLFGLLNGWNEEEKRSNLTQCLRRYGLNCFAQAIIREPCGK